MTAQPTGDPDVAARLQRWSKKLSSLPNLALPTDYPRPSKSNRPRLLAYAPGPPKLVEAAHSLALPASLTPTLMRLTLEFSALFPNLPLPTPYHLLLSSFAVLLFRFTPDPSLVICTSADGTARPLLLKLDIDSEMTFFDVVKQILEQEAESTADAVSLKQLDEHLKPEGPLYRVRFCDSTQMESDPKASLTTDLTLYLLAQDSSVPATRTSIPAMSLRMAYNSLLFTQSRISTMLETLLFLLGSAASHDAAHPLGSLPLRPPAQDAILPDPKADLDWCGFKGAIPDIFMDNAKSHPDRICVVQSQAADGQDIMDGPSRGKRTFTYGQIDRASNVIAHALLKNGLERGEVVMVYAARSVEMVVCVMGILKAGGVFSVCGGFSLPAHDCHPDDQILRILLVGRQCTFRSPSRALC